MTEAAKYHARQSKAGLKGGLSTKRKHGTKFFQKIARRRWRMVRQNRGV